MASGSVKQHNRGTRKSHCVPSRRVIMEAAQMEKETAMRCTIGRHTGELEMTPHGAMFIPEGRPDVLLYVLGTGKAAVYRRNGDGDWMLNSEVIELPHDGDRWNLTQRELWPAASLLDLAVM